MSLYDLSHTPGSYANPLAFLGYNNYLANFSKGFNTSLTALAKSQNIAMLSALDLFAKFASKPTTYGFNASWVKDSCLVPATLFAPRRLCPNPDLYIYIDTLHVSSSQFRKILLCLIIVRSAYAENPFFIGTTG